MPSALHFECYCVAVGLSGRGVVLRVIASAPQALRMALSLVQAKLQAPQLGQLLFTCVRTYASD